MLGQQEISNGLVSAVGVPIVLSLTGAIVYLFKMIRDNHKEHVAANEAAKNDAIERHKECEEKYSQQTEVVLELTRNQGEMQGKIEVLSQAVLKSVHGQQNQSN